MKKILKLILLDLCLVLILCFSGCKSIEDLKFDHSVEKMQEENHLYSPYKGHPNRNNPFDIEYCYASKGFKGCTGEQNGFCVFSTLEYGARAGMICIIHGYINKGYDTVNTLIRRYSATDQDAYVNFVATGLGVHPNDKLAHNEDMYVKIGHLITVFEGQCGKNGIATSTLRQIVEKFGIEDMQECKELLELGIPGTLGEEIIDTTNN